MANKIKRIVISVFKDELTDSLETEKKEIETLDQFQNDLEDVCSNYHIEVDSIDFYTR